MREHWWMRRVARLGLWVVVWLALCGAAEAGLLGYWDFDDAGDPATALDSSGKANHGTITGATYTASGGGHTGSAGDHAMDFGTYGNGATVSIPSAASGAFDSIAANNAATVALWIYGGAQQPCSDNAFGFYDSSDGRQLQTHLPWGSEVIYWDVAGSAATGHRINKEEDDATKWKDEWNHYAFVKHGTTGNSSKIYQNGVLWHQGNTSATMGQIVSGFIGSSKNGAGSYAGLIDDFALFDKPISDAQAASLFSMAASPADLVKPYRQAVLDDNPFVYYTFDTDTGSNGSTLQDASPNPKHGTYHNDVAMDPVGIGVTSAHFNGTSNRANGTTQQPTTNDLTVECWARSDTELWNTTGMLVSKRDAFIIHPSQGGTTIKFYVHSEGWQSVPFDLGTIPGFDLRDWHHYVGTFDGTTGVLDFYVDGILRASADIGDNRSIGSSTQPTYIGFDTGSRWFDGAIDEVAIYGHVLSGDRILEHYFQGEIVPEPATVSLLGLSVLALLRRRRS